MFAATRKFIKQRQPFSKYIVETVNVSQVGGGLRMVSGWIVERFNKHTNSTEIVQHWWNVDMNGNYFDSTFTNYDVEYIVDCALSEFTVNFYEDIDSCVGSSLLLKNDEFYRVRIEGKDIHFYSIANLSTKNLYFDNGHHLFTIDRTMPYHSYLFDKAA